jgi:hypothetical protein
MTSNLSTLTNQQIVATYNQAAESLGRPQVKKFRDKRTAIKRTEAILSELTPAPAKKKQSKPLDLPYRGHLHAIRENTINERFIIAMRNGATLDELAEIVTAYDRANGNPPQQTHSRARQIMRALHTYTGLGIRQDGNVFYIIEEAQ